MFSSAVELALEVALRAHDGQHRKGGGRIPYAVHPVHMAIVLARHGLDEVTVQAALLHDVVEDCDDWDLVRLERRFSARVVGIVAELTEDTSLTWRERKEAGIAKVAAMSEEAASVKAVDSLHNYESMSVALEKASHPGEVWSHFTGGRDGTLEIAERMVAALSPRIPSSLAEALTAALARLRGLAG